MALPRSAARSQPSRRENQMTSPACPHFASFDAFATDPFPALAIARKEAPVFFSEQLQAYVVTRYEDAVKIFAEPQVFTMGGLKGAETFDTPPDLVERIGPSYQMLIAGGTLTTTDPPQHTRLRKAMQTYFTPRQVVALEPAIQDLANSLVDAFVDAGEADILRQFTGLLGAGVIAQLLGVPEYGHKFREWANAKLRLGGGEKVDDEEERLRLFTTMVEYDDFVREHVELRRANPGDDLISSFIAARTPDGEPAMSEAELLANVSAMVSAGTDTSATLLANMVYYLLREGLWEKVKADRSLVPQVVEETMRYMGPVRSVPRRVASDTVVGGIPIPDGALVYVVLQSANRDEEAYPDADTFDPERPDPQRHYGFGMGARFCLGASLARAEARIGLETLLDRLPNPRLNHGDAPLDLIPLVVIPVLKSVPVEWDVA